VPPKREELPPDDDAGDATARGDAPAGDAPAGDAPAGDAPRKSAISDSPRADPEPDAGGNEAAEHERKAGRRDVAVADTLPPEDDAGDRRSSDDPPVASWDRFELLGLLGRGGMGAVYKAHDRRIDRIVAIKFLHSVDPTLTMRLLQEARAQGKVEHPNVCGVHDTGHVQGRAYIVLQYIDGKPLSAAAADMTLEHKVAVMRTVALAVHAAHERGIVHRDLKPANVLVERTDDGRGNPIVMDFGLARELASDVGITQSGIPLGTPAYMPPEQARGDGRAVDRRSDIYSLGATLYELWTGSVPLPATTPYEAVERAIHDDPPALRSLVPSLPIDLETIALKCLAKDPAQRYPSARALADDLGRYLAGDPILGRREPLWQRLARRARRNRALVTLGAGSLVAILVVAALGIRTWMISAERARLAERLGRETSEIESSLQVAYLQPLHDIRGDRAGIRDRMHRIAALRPDLGEFGDATVHHALGRGHAALHEWREAADELARAAAGGIDTPELHATRGRALGELYRRALDELRRSPDRASAPSWFTQQQRDIEQRYLSPALAELEASRGAAQHAELLDARIELYRRAFDAAEQKARALAEREPGSSEARRVVGDAAYGAATEAFDRGRYDDARESLQRAITAYDKASAIARSDASLYESSATARLQLAEVDVRQSRPTDTSFNSVLAVIDDGALRADPDDAAGYAIKSDALLRRYRPLIGHDDERPSLLDQIAHAATRAVEIEPSATAWTSLGMAHISRCIYEIYHGSHSADWCQRAIAELGKALALEPDHLWANNGLGMAHRWLGASVYRSGGDPLSQYEKGRRSYERASSIDPQYVAACSNQVELSTSIAEYQDATGIDPRPAVDDAQRVGDRCLAINPNFYSVFNHLAGAQLALAHHLIEIGDPSLALAQARKYIDRSDAIRPGHIEVWYSHLVADSIEAMFRLRHGLAPTGAIAAGRKANEEAQKLMPRNALCYVAVSRLDLVEAMWAARGGASPIALLRRARDDANTATVIDDHRAEAYLAAAEACLQLATVQPARDVIDDGMNYVAHALALNPRLVKGQAVRTALLELHAP
jgi:serine/threonine-protein kinase